MRLAAVSTLLLLLALGGAQTQTQNQGDIDSIIASVFGPAPGQAAQVAPVTPGAPAAPAAPAGDLQPSKAGDGSSSGSPGATYACTTAEGTDGECVPYYLCRNSTINTDGEGIIDIRVKDGPCESYLEVCCLSGDRAPEPITPATPPAQVRNGCGWRNPNGLGFRIKGDNDNEAKFAEFPWMVAILKEEPVDEADSAGAKLNVYVCGGSLIHPRAVLTAAHCVHRKPGPLRVRAGEWDTQTTNELYPYQDRDVAEVIVHKDFAPSILFYDIALLVLASPMELTQNVAVACLPPAAGLGGRRPERAAAGARCQASGWGKDSFGKEGRYQVILKRVEVPVVSREVCLEKLRSTRLGRKFELHTSFMCAGGEPGKDTCKGDGGSPLVCPVEYEEDRYQQFGIVAWGIGCGENGVPGVYVDVSQLRGWIDDKIISKGLDTASYTY